MDGDIFGTGAVGGGTNDIFGAAGGNDIFGTQAPAPAAAAGTNASTDIFGTTGTNDIFGTTTGTGNTKDAGTKKIGGTDVLGLGNTTTDIFGTSGDIFGATTGAAANNATNTDIAISGDYDIKVTKEKVEYQLPTFLLPIENHFREMGHAEGTGGRYQDFTHLYPVDRTALGKTSLPQSSNDVREAVGLERWKEKSKLLGNTQQIALQYQRGIAQFHESVMKLDMNVRTWRKNLRALLDNQLNAVKAKIEKVEIDYMRSYDLQKYLHRRILVVLSNKDLLGAPLHNGHDEAAFNEKVEELAKQIRVTENFRARIEHLKYAQQRQSATKPQYEATIPKDTRRTLVSFLTRQKNVLAVLSQKVSAIRKDMRIIRQWHREKRNQSTI